ncbi:hypothetical protein C122C_0156 [Leuconostoc gelidum subsp. gasicomitatum]|jgi:hypothetical protein|uniref:Uncharacterized protein n=1 Tax=Leuconostoc gasicomitatum TaxID=115778 RepID=A0ABM9V557_9LACO|nr:hypothetical protein C122C_0156 [Leuconostoc gasicomitatum]
MGVIFLNQKAYHWQVTSSGLSATRNGNRATANRQHNSEARPWLLLLLWLFLMSLNQNQ